MTGTSNWAFVERGAWTPNELRIAPPQRPQQPGCLSFAVRHVSGRNALWVPLTRNQVRRLRDTLTDWLDQQQRDVLDDDR